jgi:hypothetical protein
LDLAAWIGAQRPINIESLLVKPSCTFSEPRLTSDHNPLNLMVFFPPSEMILG